MKLEYVIILICMLVIYANHQWIQTKQYNQIIYNQEAMYAAICGQPIDLTHDFGTKPLKDPNPRSQK